MTERSVDSNNISSISSGGGCDKISSTNSYFFVLFVRV